MAKVRLIAALAAIVVVVSCGERTPVRPTEAQISEARAKGLGCLNKGNPYGECISFCYDYYPWWVKPDGKLGLGGHCKAAIMEEIAK